MSSFWGNIFKREDRERETQDLLKRIPIFERLNTRELGAVERILYRREYAAGELVFRQGEPGVGMYIIVEGRVTISYEPTELVLAELRDGDFFGEIALLNDVPRSATARAKTDAVLLGFFQPDLMDLIERNPRLGVKILIPLAQVAGQRLIRSNREAMELGEEIERLRRATAEGVAPPSNGTTREDATKDYPLD